MTLGYYSTLSSVQGDTNPQKVPSQPMFPQIDVALALHSSYLLVPPAATCCGSVSWGEQQSPTQSPVNLLQVQLVEPPASSTFQAHPGCVCGNLHCFSLKRSLEPRPQGLTLPVAAWKEEAKTPTRKGKRNVLCGRF